MTVVRLTLLALSAVLVTACALVPGSSGGSGQTAKLSNDEVFNLKTADRQKTLLEGAQREKELVWYTVDVAEITEPVKAAWAKKYPGVELTVYRANSEQVTERVLREYQANTFTADIADGTSTGAVLKKAGYAAAFETPAFDDLSAELKDPERKWIAQYIAPAGVAYNTSQVSEADAPKSYQDLLNPKWKGKMAASTSGKGGPGFVGNILEAMGEKDGMAYLEKLAQQGIINSNGSTRAITDQVIAGEYAMNIYASGHHVAFSRTQGAPVNWKGLEPVPVEVTVTAVLTKAPHPNAAMLFVDFLHSTEGQQLYREAFYVPANPKVESQMPELHPAVGKYKANFVAPEALGANIDKWTELYRKMFVK